MVYEDRDEMDLAEEDRLYDSDPYRGAEFSDTFREQLSDEPAAEDEDTMSEDEVVSGAGPVSGADVGATEPAHTDEFGETRDPASGLSEDELDKERLSDVPRDPYQE